MCGDPGSGGGVPGVGAGIEKVQRPNQTNAPELPTGCKLKSTPLAATWWFSTLTAFENASVFEPDAGNVHQFDIGAEFVPANVWQG